MPIYIYQAKNTGCPYCVDGFELLQKMSDETLKTCPRCGNKVEKIFAPFQSGESKSKTDRTFQEKGFHKLKRVDKGKYEKLY